MMGHTGHALGILSPGSPEDLRHRGFFGVSAEVAVKAWNEMEELDLLPPSAQFQHYLWALAFMRTYPPNDATLSILLGGKDPKTIHKYMSSVIQKKVLVEINSGCEILSRSVIQLIVSKFTNVSLDTIYFTV